jgi:hypothetical protein
MAKRVICECPSCHVEMIVDKAQLIDDPLLECGVCGATIEVDFTPPPGDVRDETGPPAPVRESEESPPPQTKRSGAAIARTAPMVPYVAPLPPREEREAREAPKPAPSVSPLTLALVGAAGIAVGWLAHEVSGGGGHDATLDQVRDYCTHHAPGRSAVDMCEFLDVPPPK